jgi:type II secretory pathway pseudopilin PulG
LLKESFALAESLRHHDRASPPCRGFTLLESLMAAGILLLVVVAVTAALTAAQRQSYEGQQRIAAGLAAEEMMSRLLVVDYNNLPSWDGHSEAVGDMTNVAGLPLPDSFDGIGRRVSVTTTLRVVTNLNIRVRGRTVTVVSHDSADNPLAALTRFIPEPQA